MSIFFRWLRWNKKSFFVGGWVVWRKKRCNRGCFVYLQDPPPPANFSALPSAAWDLVQFLEGEGSAKCYILEEMYTTWVKFRVMFGGWGGLEMI